MVFRFPENAFLSQKIDSTFLLIPYNQISPPGYHYHPPTRGKLIIPSRQHFFENLFPPAERGGERGGNCAFKLFLFVKFQAINTLRIKKFQECFSKIQKVQKSLTSICSLKTNQIDLKKELKDSASHSIYIPRLKYDLFSPHFEHPPLSTALYLH